MTTWEYAPPGTPADSDLWEPLPPGSEVTLSLFGPPPEVAVKKDGVLVSLGTPPKPLPVPSLALEAQFAAIGKAASQYVQVINDFGKAVGKSAAQSAALLKLAAEPIPGTIAAQAASAAKLPGHSAEGPPKKVATAKGEAHFKVPIGSLIIPHPGEHFVAGQPSHMIYSTSEQKWIANQWHGSPQEAKEAAEKAVSEGTHHWVQAGEHTYAVHNDLDVHVPATTDLHDDADVKHAPKVVVKHGDNPEHVVLSPQSGASNEGPHTSPVSSDWKQLPKQEPKKSVTIKGKHAAWVPSSWKVYKKKASGPDEADVYGKFAVDPQGKWHLIDHTGIAKYAEADTWSKHNANNIESWVEKGMIVPDDHPGPVPDHVAPNQAEEGPGPAKLTIPKADGGSVSATKEQIHQAIQILNASTHPTQVKQPLAKAGNPLADMDYHLINKQETAQHPELKVSPGTKKAHVGQVKLAVLHYLAGKLDSVAGSDAEDAAVKDVKDTTEAQAEHAQDLTPHEHKMGEVPKQPEPEKPAPPPQPTAGGQPLPFKLQKFEEAPAAAPEKQLVTAAAKTQVTVAGTAGEIPVTEQDVKDAIQVLNASSSTAVKQPLAKAGNPLWAMDYHAINKSELAAHPEIKVLPGSKQAHVGQVKTSVLHHLQGKLDEFKTGGVTAAKDDVQQAMEIVGGLAGGIGWGPIETALAKAGNKLAGLDFMGIINQWKKDHPNSIAGKDAKDIILDWLTSHQTDMAKADQETGHDNAVELDKLAQGKLKPDWQYSSDGAIAAALVQAAEIGTPVYAFYSDHEPGVWTVKANWPPNTKSSLKATPEHKVIPHMSDGTEGTAYQPEIVSAILKNWVTQPVGKPTDYPDFNAWKKAKDAEEQAAQMEQAKAQAEAFKAGQAAAEAAAVKPPPAEPDPITEAEWKAEPDWQKLHDIFLDPKSSSANTGGGVKQGTTGAIAAVLWASWKLGKPLYLQLNDEGHWHTKDVPPEPGTWGAQTAAGYYKVTPDHRVINVFQDGFATSLGTEQVLGYAALLKPAELLDSPPEGEPVHVVVGKLSYDAPAGSKIYVYPDHPDMKPGSDHADVKYIYEPGGTWKYLQEQFNSEGTPKPASISVGQALTQGVKTGKLVPWEPSKGEPVTIGGEVKHHAPAGTSLWYFAHQDPAKDPATKIYMKYPDGTWHVMFGGQFAPKEPKTSASTAATLNDFLAKGHFKPYNALAEQVLKEAQVKKVVPEPAPEPELPPEASEVAPDIAIVIKGKQVGVVPAGSKIYHYANLPAEAGNKFVLYPDGHWEQWHKNGPAEFNPDPESAKQAVEQGIMKEEVATPAKPEPAEGEKAETVPEPAPVPEGEPVPVIYKGKITGTVPPGSKFYTYKPDYSGSPAMFVKLPDGKWKKSLNTHLSDLSSHSVPKLDILKEVPPPTAAEIAKATEVGKLKDKLAAGAVAIADAKKDPFAFLASLYSSKSPNYLGQEQVISKNKDGVIYSSGYVSTGVESWTSDSAFNVTHTFPDGKTEQIPFEQVKAGMEQYIQPDTVALSPGTLAKHGFYYNPKGKAYLEIKHSTGNAYYAHKKAVYIWHQVDGTTKQVTAQYAMNALAKNTEWHAEPKVLGTSSTVKVAKYATTAGSGVHGVWSEADGAGGPQNIDIKPDGTALVSNVDIGTKQPLTSADNLLKAGAVIDKYGTTVVKPGVVPTHYHLFGAKAKTKEELQAFLADQQSKLGSMAWKDSVADFMGGQGEWNKLKNAYVQKFYSDKGYTSGQDQQNKLIALLNELLLVPEQQTLGTVEPKFLKSLPEGISTAKQVFGWTDTGYAKPFTGGIDLKAMAVATKPELSAKIKAISDEYAGGKVVGTHISSLSAGELLSWLHAWKSGDMTKIFALDAAGGKVSPVHPGAPDNVSTHHVNWAPWDPGQVPASKSIDGNWTPEGTDPSLAEVQNYLIKVNVQHAAYLSASDWRKLVKAHQAHDQEVVDQLSQKADTAFKTGAQPVSEPPKWTDDVKPAKSYDVYIENGTGVAKWSSQAVNDYIAANHDAILPFAEQYATEQGYTNASQLISEDAYSGNKNVVLQTYLDDVAAKAEAEKLRPKWELVPGDSSRVKDQFGHTMLWHTGTKKDLAQRVAVAKLARAWGYRIPLSQHAFLEADKTPGVITPEVQPLQTLAALEHKGIVSLTDRQLGDIAREHILDYAMANHGSTPGSYLMMQDGSVISASKEDAFGDLIWAGADRTGMNDWAKQPVSLIFDAIDNGWMSKDQADKVYIAAVQAARRMGTLSDNRLTQVLSGAGVSAADIGKLVDRKNSMGADIQKLWDSVYSKAGWQAPVVPEAKLSHGLHSGFSEPEFMPHALGAKSFGVPAFFGGGDLTNGHVHVWTELGPKGDRRLMGEASARKVAIDKIMGWVKAHSGEDASKMIPQGDGEFHGAILNAAESVKTHSDPNNPQYGYYGGPISTETFQKYAEAKAELQLRLSKAEAAVAKGPHSAEYQSVAGLYGDPGAVVSMAKHYLAQMDTIDQAKAVHGGLGFSPESFPGWTPANYESVAAAGVKITYKKAKRELGSSSNNLTADSWQLGKDDGELHLKSGLSTEYQGYVWEVQLPTGEILDINDSGDTQTPPGQQGRIRFRAVTDDGSASLERIRSFLQESGLNLDEATQSDMELLYWRLAASTLADRADRKTATGAKAAWDHVAKATGVSMKKVPYLGQLSEELAAKHLTPEEENAIWREAFAHMASPETIQSFTDNHGYLPQLGHFDIKNQGMTGGKPKWYRFDVTPEQVAAKPMLVNHLHDTGKDAVLLARSGGLFSGEGRLRALGTYKPGMSWASDQQKGAGGAVFLRQNMSGTSNYQVWVSPRVMAELQTYAWDSDHFGAIALKRQYAHWDFNHLTQHGSGGNEAMISDAVSLLDDVEVLQAYSEAQRKSIIADLKKAGITHIRGLPVEDRIVGSSSAVATAKAKAKEAAQKAAKTWFAPTDQAAEAFDTETSAQAAETGAGSAAEQAESGQAAAEASGMWEVMPSGNVWKSGDLMVVKSVSGYDAWQNDTLLGTVPTLAAAQLLAVSKSGQFGLTWSGGNGYTTTSGTNYTVDGSNIVLNGTFIVPPGVHIVGNTFNANSLDDDSGNIQVLLDLASVKGPQ